MSGHITDVTGAPLAGSRVRLIPDSAGRPGQHEEGRTLETSSSRGSFQFTGVPAVAFRVEAEKGGLSAARLPSVTKLYVPSLHRRAARQRIRLAACTIYRSNIARVTMVALLFEEW